MSADLRAALEADLREAELKAWDALARYKFWMFGYHAADVVKLRRRLGGNIPNPFRELVMLARSRCKTCGGGHPVGCCAQDGHGG